MTTYLTDYRTYKDVNEETGYISFTKVKYLINIKNGVLDKVFNEYNHSINEKSETFLYFKKLYEKI